MNDEWSKDSSTAEARSCERPLFACLRPISIALVLASALMAWSGTLDAREPLGYWRYKQPDRKIKVIVIGGSVASRPGPNFGRFLHRVCANIEVKNRAAVGYGAPALKNRFRRQFLQNPNVKLKAPEFKYWLLFQGGLNSIFSPDMTIKFIAETFALAHAKGVKVATISLTPWGSNRDRRFHGLKGLQRQDKTRKVVDFVMGLLPRNKALGRYAKGADKTRTQWKNGELPDIAVNLFDSEMRDKNAKLRNHERLLRALKGNRKWAKKYPDLNEAARRAAQVPQWFMKRSLHGFDHIHPNTKGHRIMAKHLCHKLPADWKCSCAQIDTVHWRFPRKQKKKR